MKQLLVLSLLLSVSLNYLFSQEEKPKKRRHVLEEYGLKRHSVEFYA